MKRTWIVGTRGSKLALTQAHIVIDTLRQVNPEHNFEIKIIKTTGDTVWDKPLALIGGKGVFVKEIEDELNRGTIDMAVHSMKDVPAELEEGLIIGAVMPREDPRDAFISHSCKAISELRPACRVGTGSQRRKAQLLRYCPGLEIFPIRGNIDTRLKKLKTENLDGIILAVSGIRRLGLEGSITQIIPAEIMVPTAGQGAIGIEIRRDGDTADGVHAINHDSSFREVTTERKIQAALGGGCNIPLGIYARTEDNTIHLSISLGNENGEILVHETLSDTTANEQNVIAEAINILRKASQQS